MPTFSEPPDRLEFVPGCDAPPSVDLSSVGQQWRPPPVHPERDLLVLALGGALSTAASLANLPLQDLPHGLVVGLLVEAHAGHDLHQLHQKTGGLLLPAATLLGAGYSVLLAVLAEAARQESGDVAVGGNLGLLGHVRLQILKTGR